jgi:hypothetical protein
MCAHHQHKSFLYTIDDTPVAEYGKLYSHDIEAKHKDSSKQSELVLQVIESAGLAGLQVLINCAGKAGRVAIRGTPQASVVPAYVMLRASMRDGSAAALKIVKIVHVGHPAVMLDADWSAVDAGLSPPLTALRVPTNAKVIASYAGATLGSGLIARSGVCY